jgi:hypothetical protein
MELRFSNVRINNTPDTLKIDQAIAHWLGLAGEMNIYKQAQVGKFAI